MKKKISLIIPAQSTDSYIEDLLINILYWTMLPDEIIIVNSSDKSCQIEINLKKN